MNKIGYIDEYGDKSIHYEKAGVSVLFIVTAIIIDKKNSEDYKEIVNNIRKSHTQAPEIKSSNFKKKDFKKRLDLLKDLSKLNFHIYSIVVDKRKIWENTGLKFRNSFFKYVNRLLDTELYRYYPNLELVADEHGDEKFMNGFIEYVKSYHIQGDLFIKPEFSFSKSHEEPMIQVADFIAGSLSKVFDPEKKHIDSQEILNILKPKIIQLRNWPELPFELYKKINDSDKEYDSTISEFAIHMINNYITEHEKSVDEGIVQQIITLSYLSFRFKSDPFEYVYTDEIISKIKQRGVAVPSVQLFRNKVIANLRDNNILIVSGQTGYKIPCSKADLIQFFNRYNHIINPMLQRLEKANDMIKIATDNKINVLEYNEFVKLDKMIKIVQK